MRCLPPHWRSWCRGASSSQSGRSCRRGYGSRAEASLISEFSDFGPPAQSFLEEILAGLRRSPKAIPCKFLYDERGSRLFEQICELDEYYLTRAEFEILEARAGEITRLIGERCLLIEYGSGSSRKTRVLLDHLTDPAGYVAIDISKEHLLRSTAALRERYPEVAVLPVCADYTGEYALPRLARSVEKKIVYFPGSTIGNFEPEEARAFLKRIAAVCGRMGGLLIGVDLHKDTDRLEAAYDDPQGVSAAFALNVLERINRELGADFRLDRFGYDAFYDEARHRIEMSIQSLEAQTVTIGGTRIEFGEGERVRTEYSHKFTLDEFRGLAATADLSVEKVWSDPEQLFSVQYLTAA